MLNVQGWIGDTRSLVHYVLIQNITCRNIHISKNCSRNTNGEMASYEPIKEFYWSEVNNETFTYKRASVPLVRDKQRSIYL